MAGRENTIIYRKFLRKQSDNSKKIIHFYSETPAYTIDNTWRDRITIYYSATATLCHLSATDIKKRFCNV